MYLLQPCAPGQELEGDCSEVADFGANLAPFCLSVSTRESFSTILCFANSKTQ